MVHASVLIEVEELRASLESATPPLVLDVRWKLNAPSMRDDYVRQHVPGAHFVDLDTELAGPPGPGRHPMPDPEVFGAALRRAGLSVGRPVVVYDDADSVSASRCWWLLRYFGHADVRVLNGGLLAWMMADLELSAEVVPHGEGDFVPAPGGMSLYDADGAALVAARGVLLDARSLERYRGDVEPIDPVAGHIPGARSAPTTENLEASGRFLDGEALHTRFRRLGVQAGDEVAVYCGSGITAAHEVLAMAVAGIDAGLYVGSWSDWITNDRRRIAVGDEEPVNRFEPEPEPEQETTWVDSDDEDAGF